MTDYFSEYSAFVGAKGLPSPADTPYETPSFIRSTRSSGATASSSREQSKTPPPLPSGTFGQDGRLAPVDPRRFTPTLHASLVSEILTLRREIESKNHLIENLETNLSAAKSEADALSDQLGEQAKEARKAKAQVHQIEKGTYDAVEELVKERDEAAQTSEELRNKLESLSKRTRAQDEDAARTQGIWEQEKESWERERRQLERRIHITENRLRTMVDEMAAQQTAPVSQVDEDHTKTVFHDSGIEHESDTASVSSESSPKVHRRNTSSVSNKTRSLISPVRGLSTPEPNGFSLADELAQDDEEEEVEEEEEEEEEEIAEHIQDASPQEVLGSSASPRRSLIQDRQTSFSSELDVKAKRVLDLLANDSPQTPSSSVHPGEAIGFRSRVLYVDTGYQPSPPRSSTKVAGPATGTPITRMPVPDISLTVEPKSLANTASVDHNEPARSYASATTQTEHAELPEVRQVKTFGHRHSLSPPSVPSIAIIPPSSRPTTPRAYALPPGTKNAFAQAHVYPNMQDAGMQTEPIRVDKRAFKLPSELLQKRGSLLPSPIFPEPPPASTSARSSVSSKAALPKLQITLPPSLVQPALVSPPLQSPTEVHPVGTKDLRSLRAIPLPKPVLSPPATATDKPQDGPLNRSAQYGVTRPLQSTSQLADVDLDTDVSDYGEDLGDHESKERTGSVHASYKPPHGRFGLSEPPKVVPEEKEISPVRRPHTAGAHSTAPAPAITGYRGAAQRAHNNRPHPKPETGKSLRSRSPSFGSMVSSSYSTQSAFPTTTLPPYPIPLRSSSWYRQRGKPYSEGSQSPIKGHATADVFGTSTAYSRRTGPGRQDSLRKVQSATVIRKSSSQKGRRRRRSPELTPVQSMAFDSIDSTHYPEGEAAASKTRSNARIDTHNEHSQKLATRPSTIAFVPEPDSPSETNLVDAIAATMVGEWMWKYVRKRKSFGLGEDNAEQSPSHMMNISVHGTRHKRWAWISPYERTIMWDNKQPTSSPALLGKKGRKLAIRSVLDVVDDTPCPKNSDLQTAFKRSILILTPDRALKFTAVTEERHRLWMTALSFVAESGRLPPPLPVPDASPRRPTESSKAASVVRRSRSPAVRRSNIRDSVHMAKSRRPSLPQPQAGQHRGIGHDSSLMPRELLSGPEPEADGGADFPIIPRLHNTSTTKHSRKRSNTSPRLSTSTANGMQSISSSAVSYTSRLHPSSTAASSYRTDGRSISSKSGSARESMTSPMSSNFFEAVGTIRMEAFVDPTYHDGVRYVPAPPPPRRRRNDSYFSTYSTDKRQGLVFDDDTYDPFRAF